MKKGAVAVLSVAATLAIVGAGVGTIAALKHNNVPMPWDAYVVPEDATFGIDKNEDGEFVRTGAAIGLKAGINGERNDFDHVGPWSKIKTVQIGDEIAVRIPKYYQNAKGTAISLVKQDSTWSVPAAFLDKNGNEKDHFDYGAYAINVDKDGAAHSQEGGAVTNGLSLNAYRAAAKKTFKSTSENKAHIASYAEYSSVIQLMAIEFGTPRFQNKLPGVRANMWDTIDTTIQAKGEKNVIYLADKKQLAVGMPIQFGEGSYQGWGVNFTKTLGNGVIKSITRKNVEVPVEATSASSASSEESTSEEQKETETRKLFAVEIDFGDDLDVAAIIASEKRNGYDGGFAISSAAFEKGFVNNHGKGSIRVTERLTDADSDSYAKYRQSFSYRGIENVYGNYYQWLDGITSLYDSETQEINVMTCLDPAKFENANNEAETANGYKTILTFDGSKSFYWEDTTVKDGFVVPETAPNNYNGGSSLPDAALGHGFVSLSAASGFRAFCTGACLGYGGGASDGAFLLNGYNDSSNEYGYCAARLSFE